MGFINICTQKTYKSFLVSFVIHIITVPFPQDSDQGGGKQFASSPQADNWHCLKTFLVVTVQRESGLLAASGQRPVMPLNSLQRMGLLPSGKNYPAPDVSGAKVERPCLRSSLKIDCLSQTFRSSLTPSIRLGLLGIRQNNFFFS